MWRWRKALQQWVLRHTPREAQTRLTQRRIYLLPTRFGSMMLLVALAVWIGALNYAVSLAYVLSFWIVALMLLSVLLAYRQLAGLQLQAGAAANVFAGDEARFLLQLQWPDTQPRRLRVRWYEADTVLAECTTPGDYALPLAAPYRGQLAMPVLRLWSEAPLGLVRAFCHVRLQAALWVYPQPLADPRELAWHGGDGESAAIEAGGDDFAGLAPWQAGQSLHRIAWRVYARRGSLAAREFASPAAAGGLASLSWDDYAANVPPEQRLSHLCWHVLQASRAGAGLLLRLPQGEYCVEAGDSEPALLALARFGVRDAGG